MLASGALRDAERKACAGIAEVDREVSPFAHASDITSIMPLVESRHIGRDSLGVHRGATVTFRAVRGITTEWLQRMIDCHVAEVAALGHEVPDMADCPLVPRGAVATVRPVRGGFAVDVRSDDETIAGEILSRAERLHATTSR